MRWDAGRPDQLLGKQSLHVPGSRPNASERRSGWSHCNRAGADSVVVAGAAVAGIAHRLRARLSVPLLDGIACAVGQTETLVRLGLRQRVAVAPLTGGSTTTGIDPSLSQLLSR